MTVTFKQFLSFVKSDESDPVELTEIFGKFFNKSKDDNEEVEDEKSVKRKIVNKLSNAKNITVDDLIAKKKELEKKKALKTYNSDALNRAKERGGKYGKSNRDDYALHREVEKHEFLKGADRLRNMSLARESKDTDKIIKNPGFFTMTDANKISKLDLNSAKSYLLHKIDSTENANPDNVRKAKSMIEKANTTKKLVIDVGNFILAHESSKNKVIKFN